MGTDFYLLTSMSGFGFLVGLLVGLAQTALDRGGR